MALLGWELRKIWRPALLAAIALIGLVFWQIRTEFYIEHLGSSWEDEIGLANRWLEEYGTTIEPAERSELDGQLAEAKEAFAPRWPRWTARRRPASATGPPGWPGKISITRMPGRRESGTATSIGQFIPTQTAGRLRPW